MRGDMHLRKYVIGGARWFYKRLRAAVQMKDPVANLSIENRHNNKHKYITQVRILQGPMALIVRLPIG